MYLKRDPRDDRANPSAQHSNLHASGRGSISSSNNRVWDSEAVGKHVHVSVDVGSQFQDASEGSPVLSTDGDTITTVDNTGTDFNFTWEHFFTSKCGILHDDALLYERRLIENRMSPVDTVVDSLALVFSVARMPPGDRHKVGKTISRQVAAVLSRKAGTALTNASHVFRFDNANEFRLSYGPFGTVASVGETSLFMDQWKDPTQLVLLSFGYKSFDYTRDKDTPEPLEAKGAVSGVLDVLQVLLAGVITLATTLASTKATQIIRT